MRANMSPSFAAFALLCSLSLSLTACDHEGRDLLDESIEESDLRVDELDEVQPASPSDASAPSELTERGEPVGFDDETQTWLYDADGDSWPDITEQRGGTDMLDPSSHPGPDPDANFPAIACRPGFIQAGSRMCINQNTQNATTYANASVNCRNQYARVCSYEDLTYLYVNTGLDATYNPMTSWIGNIVADNSVLCGNVHINNANDPDIWDFENACHKNDPRPYWCCHDDDG